MTDKERYKRTFSALRASQLEFKEEMTMNKTKILPVRRLVSLCAAALMIAAMASVAYAADVGGIRRAVQVWIHGDQTNAVMDIQNGHYLLSYEDENGEPQTVGGGGVAIDAFGRERPLTEEELLEELNSPKVECLEDGTVWVYYQDQKMEITDRFVDGVCYVQLKDGDKVLYLTVEADGGYSMSPHGYVQIKQQSKAAPYVQAAP